MPRNFLTCDREQSFLLPPDVRDWLPEDYLAWFVIDSVGVMDLDAFYAGYREDGVGRAAYEPAMMVALLLYCWSRGVRSSRRIQRACVEDVACRVLAALRQPDHATIARFIERHEAALAGLFGEVLWLCAGAGLATVGVVAIDGTKLAANANRDRTLDYDQIAREIVEQAIATDAAEDAVHGERSGDELPEERPAPSRPRSDRQRSDNRGRPQRRPPRLRSIRRRREERDHGRRPGESLAWKPALLVERGRTPQAFWILDP